jgi:hypothetical protein
VRRRSDERATIDAVQTAASRRRSAAFLAVSTAVDADARAALIEVVVPLSEIGKMDADANEKPPMRRC